MSLENIPSALFTAGSGGIAGFLVGFAIKKVMKLVAIIAGVFFGALMYLQYQGILAINWDKLQSISESMLLMIGNLINNVEPVSNITASLGIPLTGGLSAGLVIGLSKG
jgi:uncharacterized membrane protein (Fun14 family)